MLIYGVSAIIVLNLTRIIAVKLATIPGPIGTVGRGMGALVTFGA